MIENADRVGGTCQHLFFMLSTVHALQIQHSTVMSTALYMNEYSSGTMFLSKPDGVQMNNFHFSSVMCLLVAM